jgi:VWFA-related protein
MRHLTRIYVSPVAVLTNHEALMSRLWSNPLLALSFALPLLAQDTPKTVTVTSQEPPAQAQPQQPANGAPTQPTQNPDGTYTVRVSTRIVVLDVVATNKDGSMTQGLSKENFHITESGDPQTITNFELGTVRLPKEDVDIESTADLDRLAPRAPVNIILLDEFNTRFEDEAFAQYSLKKYLEKQPDHMSTPTMLIAVGIDKFDVLRDYTQNKQLLLDALKHHFSGNPWRNNSMSWAAERYGTAFLTLRRISEASIGHQGHKNMIWIGRGFPALHFEGQPVDTMNRINSLRQDCVNLMRDARITLTTIDPAGLQIDPGVYGEAARFNDPFGGNYEFAQLAQATGGRTIYGRNDVDVQIGAAAQEGTAFYTLVYHPTNVSRDPRQFRKIAVSIDRPNVTLTTTKGYYLAYRPARVDPKAPNRRLMSDLVSAADSKMAYDGAEIKVSRVADDPKTFKIYVAPRSLAWTLPTDADPKRHTDIVIVVTQFDKKGKPVGTAKASSMKFGAPANAPATGRLELPLNFSQKIDLEGKATRARFVVRIGASGRIGTADIDLTEPMAVSTTPPPDAAPAPPAPPPSQQ